MDLIRDHDAASEVDAPAVPIGMPDLVYPRPVAGRWISSFLQVVLVCAALACLATVAIHRPRLDDLRAASPSEVANSLAQGAAWIWPASNGPQTSAGEARRYREAAVLVESLTLRSTGVEHGARLDPLILPADVRLLPVIHVEAAGDAPDTFSADQIDAVLGAVRRQAGLAAAGAKTLQLDFEAPARELPAYRALIASVREALPKGIHLSVTTLVNWCFQGHWVDDLPADEVVPMVFGLGSQPEYWISRLMQGGTDGAQRCHGPALGFSTDEPPPVALLLRTTHPFWFDRHAWSNPAHPTSF